VLLSHLPGTAENRVVDAIKFKGQPNEISLGRYPDGGPFWYQMSRTRDTANAAGLPGLIITEVMYHPPDLGPDDNTRDEFVEIYNPTDRADHAARRGRPLATGRWHCIHVPAATTLPPGGSLLVVSFNPADLATLAEFRGAHGITNLSLPILGPYSGKLGNRSNRVGLERPSNSRCARRQLLVDRRGRNDVWQPKPVARERERWRAFAASDFPQPVRR
jgi:hypothetical protein